MAQGHAVTVSRRELGRGCLQDLSHAQHGQVSKSQPLQLEVQTYLRAEVRATGRSHYPRTSFWCENGQSQHAAQFLHVLRHLWSDVLLNGRADHK